MASPPGDQFGYQDFAEILLVREICSLPSGRIVQTSYLPLRLE
jgi:hypothetical protein